MKKTIFLLAGAVVMLFTACTKDDSLTHLQAHNDNEMMTLMHQMMSNMDTVPKTSDPEIDLPPTSDSW